MLANRVLHPHAAATTSQNADQAERQPSIAQQQQTASALRDEATLAHLGYKQELDRSWSLVHNFGASFSIISVITGLTTLFSYGLNTGGPAVMVWGWVVVSCFTMFVALGMAEITSAHPTSGGPYFWAAMLAPSEEEEEEEEEGESEEVEKEITGGGAAAAAGAEGGYGKTVMRERKRCGPKGWAPFFSWVTGWFNFLGQVAVTTGIEFGCAGLISDVATLKGGYEPTPARTIGITAALTISHGLINTFGVKLLRHFNNVSIALHSVGSTAFAIAIVAAAPTHQSADFVFRTYIDNTGVEPIPDASGGSSLVGWGERASPAYVVVTGLLISQWTITGYDASAHMSEETRNAGRSAPLGVLTSVACSAAFGWLMMLCLLFSIQDVAATVAGSGTAGQPVLQILLDVFGPDGAIALWTLLLCCVWHCGLFSVASNSRMMFAFARDSGIPRWFAGVDSRNAAPVRTIWLACALSFALALPSLGSSVAFTAATSIATIGLYISYALPILEACIWHDRFKAQRGPFSLGVASRPIQAVAVTWVSFILIVFCLPNQNPVGKETLNYTSVAVGVIAVGSVTSWLLGARRWFTGPRRQVDMDAIVVVDGQEKVVVTERGVVKGDGKGREDVHREGSGIVEEISLGKECM